MNTTLTRRQMLKMSAGALLAARLWPGRLRAADVASADEFPFLVINDLHYSSDECNPYFEKLIREITALPVKPEFVLIVGDLVDNGTLAQCKALKELLKPLPMPYHVTAGNHDSGTQTDRSAFDEVFGKNMNYTFDAHGWQFVGLDTSDGVKVSKFDARRETMDFVAGLASKLDKQKPTILFTHFPLGPDVKYRLQNADDLLAPLKEHNIQAIYNGHYHAFTEKTLGHATVTTNRCCSRIRNNHDGTKEKGYFLCRTRGGSVAREFIEYSGPVPATQPGTQPATTPA